MSKQIIVIKVGGKPATNQTLVDNLLSEMKSLSDRYSFIFVHGGGAEVTAYSKQFGIEAQFVDGKRVTSSEEMSIVDAVLCGKVNKQLVRQFNQKGLTAVGISGSDANLFVGKKVADNSRTGAITKVNGTILQLLMNSNFVPVISSTSIDEDDFLGLNINADDVALAISSELCADKLIFISDIPGVLNDGKVIPTLNEASISQFIESAVINGGMIPKVKASLNALKAGAKSVVIGTYAASGELAKLIDGFSGTLII